MKLHLLLIILIGITGYSSAQSMKTEVLTLTGSYSASNGGFFFNNAKGDTIFACPTHPDSCLVKHKMENLYSDNGGPELKTKFAGKKYMVTYSIDDPTMTDNGNGPSITATVTKMKLIK